MTKTETGLRKRIKELEREVEELRNDRTLFRDHFQQRFKWWIELLGESKTPKMTWLVENDAMWLRKFKWWVW